MADRRGAIASLVAGLLLAGWIALVLMIRAARVGSEPTILLDALVQAAFVLTALLVTAPIWARIAGVGGGAMGFVGALLQFPDAGADWLLWLLRVASLLVGAWALGRSLILPGPVRIVGIIAGVLFAVGPFVYASLDIHNLWILPNAALAMWLVWQGWVAPAPRP